MNETDTPGFEALLQRPALAVLSAPVRDALLAAWIATPQTQPLRLPMAGLGDMCDALARLNADEAMFLAALLADVPDLRAARSTLGLSAAMTGVVDGLLDSQDAADQVWALHAGREAGRNGEGLRRLLLAIIRDLRVVPILLARQLALLKGAPQRSEEERRALAQLTRDIHGPLANRLGIWQLKWELEDMAFRFLEPETYRHIAREVDETRLAREHYVENVKSQLTAGLAEHGVRGEVTGRPKHIYSIWRKMQKKRLSFDQLYDLRAVRVMVDDVASCYAALGVVHALWVPVPSEFDDYIARPKANDYRSLHTAVIGPEGRTIEVQIRTHQMHAQAELGVAAHWKYKEGGGRSGENAFERKITWMRQLLEQSGEGGSEELAGALDAELLEDRVYALSPKGEVLDLPAGATPLDFAYQVHTMVGHRCRGAKVNGRIVPLTYRLRSGDRVEILTGKEPDPRRDWLLPSAGYLASGRSREKVRGWFHKLDRARNVEAGRELLDKELRRLGLMSADLGKVLARFRAESVEELLIQVALGDTGPSGISRALLEADKPVEPPAPVLPRPTARPVRSDTSGFTIEGVGNLLVQLGKCCRPVAGEPVSGYLTQSRGVTVHRVDCSAFARLSALHPERVMPVEWGRAGSGYEADIQILAVDRRWLLKDITNLIAQEDAFVLSINSDNVRGSGQALLRLRLKVSDYGQLSTLLGKIEALPGVDQVRRLG